MIDIAFLIRSLEYGGAERQLVTLAKRLDKSKFKVSVLCFYPDGILEKELTDHDIPVYSLDKKGRWDILTFLVHYIQIIKTINPQILHGYLEVSNLLSVFIKIFMPNIKSVFGVRASFMDMRQYDRLYRLVRHIEAFFSKCSDLIIVNSHAGKEKCIQRGFSESKIEIIENGIDVSYYRKDTTKRDLLRKAWNISESQILIGLVGRIDVMKDHATFLKAASLSSNRNQDLRFICVGDGNPEYWQQMKELGSKLELNNILIWAGAQNDMPAVYNSLDILCSSSIGEGFSNVIGEAMACTIPCMVTDVGDSAIIVDKTGEVVPSGDPEALAEAFLLTAHKSANEREEMGKACRHRIESLFSQQRMVEKTENILTNLAQPAGNP